jgi:hypothetical protein
VGQLCGAVGYKDQFGSKEVNSNVQVFEQLTECSLVMSLIQI